MSVKIFKIIFFFLFSYNMIQSQNFWKAIPDPIHLSSSRFTLDTASFFAALEHHQPIILPISDVSFTTRRFKVRSNFATKLAVKYPAIRSYFSDEIYPAIYLDYYDGKIKVFQIRGPETFCILPDLANPNTYILSSNTTSILSNAKPFECLTQSLPRDQIATPPGTLRTNQAGPINKRTYRMALAATAEYASIYGSNKEQVLAGINADITRINAVYTHELGIDFKLVDNNDTLIFLDSATDPYANGNLSAMISQNTEAINTRIGLNNYDIGHVFGTGGGGLAQLSSVCTASKGAGVSSPFGTYSETNFYLIASHEIGHQLGAEHSFNLCDNQNESATSGYEPGSGSTIMSYAGASSCGPNYIQGISDAYFHSNSIQQIKSFSRNGIGSLCGALQPSSQNEPITTIISPNGAIIPVETPFELEGMATDDNPNGLTYTWEQLDLGPKSILGKPSGTAPLFRSQPPSKSPIRIFPKLVNVLKNIKDINEVLPNITRALNFRFMARDNDTIGATGWSDIMIQAHKSAGPFRISTFNFKDSLYRNDFVYVTWDVAQTDLMPILCKKVSLYWSTDGGQSFNTVLVKDTPNDGGEWITIPTIITDQARIKIKANGNIFFDINDADLKVLDRLNPELSLATQDDNITICEGTSQNIFIRSSTSSNNDTINLLYRGSNQNVSVQFSKTQLTKNDSTLLTIHVGSNLTKIPSFLPILGINTRTKDTISLDLKLNILRKDIQFISPANNQDQVNTSPAFKWNYSPGKNEYLFELAESPSFEFITWSKKLGLSDTTVASEQELNRNQLYYWRVRPIGFCDNTTIPFSIFHTQSLSCKLYKPQDLPKFISATSTPRITSEIIVTDTFKLAQLSLPLIHGTHDFIGDLTFSIIAPSGDSVLLWNRLCNNLSNFNIGLDDQAIIPVTCPITDRKLHKPEQSFNKLYSSPIQGSWKLRVQDANNGAGGSLDDWSLQLCGSIAGNGPTLTINKIIELFELKTKVVTNKELEAKDIDSDPSQVKYVLLQTPGLGYFIKNRTDTLKVGSEWVQSDLNAGLVVFVSSKVERDTFETIAFLLIDEKNNWLSNHSITIKVLNDITIAHKDIDLPHLIRVSPNPFRDRLKVENLSNRSLTLNLYSSTGVLMTRFTIASNSYYDFESNLPSGLYFLQYGDLSRRFRSIKIIALSN